MSDRSIAFAEISTSGDRRSVRRVATFEYPAGVSLETPEAAGQAASSACRRDG
jgi:hypothetical protein